jgi:hypothetical protein
MTVHTDVEYNRQYLLDFENKILSKSWMPWWCPLYSIVTHWQQRNRNYYLASNNLKYRPYKFRANTVTSDY